MNKYQWLRRQHGINENWLKKIIIILIIIVMVFLMLKGCRKISQDFWDKLREKSLETIAASFITAECWDDSNREFEMPDLIMREFYPVGSLYNGGDDIKTVEADVGEYIETEAEKKEMAEEPETETGTESENGNGRQKLSRTAMAWNLNGTKTVKYLRQRPESSRRKSLWIITTYLIIFMWFRQ